MIHQKCSAFKKEGILFQIHLTIGILAWLLYGQPTPLDGPSSKIQSFGNDLFFLFWLIGVIQWGRFFTHLAWPADGGRIEHAAGILTLGSGFASFCSGLAFLFFPTWMGNWGKEITFFGCLLGNTPLLLKTFTQKDATQQNSKSTSWTLNHRLLGGLLIAWLLLIHLQGFVLHPHGDPFMAYLTAPVQWFFAKSPTPFFENPFFFLMSTWENLFLWGSCLLAQGPNQGLDAVQRFAQWCTTSLGTVGLLFSIISLSKKAVQKKKESAFFEKQEPLLLASMVAVSLPILRAWVVLCKNDLNLSFWILSGVVPLLSFFFFSKKDSPPRFSWLLSSGFLLSLGSFGKPPYFVFTLILGLCVLVWFHRSPSLKKAILFLSLGGLLGATPVLLRNLIWTGNPIYPWFQNWLDSPMMGPTLKQGMMNPTLAPKTTFWLFLSYLKEAWTQQPWSLFAPVGLFLFSSLYSFLLTVGILSSFFFCAVFRGATEVRYLAPTSLLIGTLGFLSLWALCEHWIRHQASRFLIQFLLALKVILELQIPLYALWQLSEPRYHTGSSFIRTHRAGEAKYWLRQHASSKDVIATLGIENEGYYMTGWHWRKLDLFPKWDKELQPYRDGSSSRWNWPKTLEWIETENIRYLYFLKKDNEPFTLSLSQRLDTYPDCLRYEDLEAKIFEAPCLLQHASQLK